MSTDAATHLQLPHLAAGQAQKHVTVNERLQKLDALVQLAVVSATTTAEPGAPDDGDLYVLPAGKTGTHWAAMAVAHSPSIATARGSRFGRVMGFRRGLMTWTTNSSLPAPHDSRAATRYRAP